MKKIYYTITLTLCMCLAACETEDIVPADNNHQIEQNEDGSYLINPEDTAGIVVPKGYSLVLFPATKAQTRASASGTNTQVSHLQYLIYEKDAAGIFKFHKQTVISKPGNWPAKIPAIPLPQGKEYRVVFLGNVDKNLFGSVQTEELLTGAEANSAYGDARIHLPKVSFNNENLFYMANLIFNTNPGSITNNTVYVPVTLKRIVNKVEICKTPLTDQSKNYTQANQITQILNEKIIGKLAKTGGPLHRGITASVDTLVMSLVYVGTKGCATEADAYFAANPTTYPVLKYRYNNIGAGKTYQLPELRRSLDEVATKATNWVGGLNRECNYASSDISQNIIVRFAQYIHDYFHKGLDNGNVNEELFGTNGILNTLWTTHEANNVAKITKITETAPLKDVLLFDFTTGISKGVLNALLPTDLTTEFTNTVKAENATDKLRRDFSPLGTNNGIYIVTVNRMPSVITFDLEVVGYLNNNQPTELTLRMQRASQGYKGPSLSVISLGNPADKLAITGFYGPYSGTLVWNESLLSDYGTAGHTNLLLTDPALNAKQAANTYRKCVHSVSNVDLQDWSQTAGTTSYPINSTITLALWGNEGDGAPMTIKESKASGDKNYHRTITVNGTNICENQFHALAAPLCTIAADVSGRLRARSNYASGNQPHISWIPLPKVKDNLNNYISSWSVTNEDYTTVSE